jgi:hypothetical protein
MVREGKGIIKILKTKIYTLQSVNGPLLELLKRNLCCRWDLVEIETMGIVLLLVCRRRELLFFVVQGGPPFGVDSMKVLSNHAGSVI